MMAFEASEAFGVAGFGKTREFAASNLRHESGWGGVGSSTARFRCRLRRGSRPTLIRHAIAAAQRAAARVDATLPLLPPPVCLSTAVEANGARLGSGLNKYTHQRNGLVDFEQAARKGRQQLNGELDLGYHARRELQSRVWPSAAKSRAELEEGRQLARGDCRGTVSTVLPLRIHRIELVYLHARDSTPDSTETNLRYAAYTNRIRTLLSSAQRYVAYTSDIGESFRPVAHPNLVRAAYGVSWAYILGDVSYEGYKAYLQNQKKRFPATQFQAWRDGTSSDSNFSPRAVPPLEDYRTVMVQRGVFQSLASMGLPAFTIHSVVKYSGKAMKDVKNQRLRAWGPIGLGLGIVPFLPSLFDQPVENAVEWVFHEGFKRYGGEAYTGNAPATGRERALENKLENEKEL